MQTERAAMNEGRTAAAKFGGPLCPFKYDAASSNRMSKKYNNLDGKR